jgi:deoxyribonuclease V
MIEKIPSIWLHPTSLEEAIEVQKNLAARVLLEDSFESIQTIAGVDVSNNLKDPTETIYAAAVALDYQTMQINAQGTAIQKQEFPYIPGLLGFREAPAVVEAISKVNPQPQLVMVDGHGISHPRRLGIASHIGVLLDIPTIGVAKSILIGKLAEPLGSQVGDCVPLIWKGNQIAMVIRTKARCNPLIISAGHRISLESAVRIVQNCLRGYRLPEPTRQAHLAANVVRRQFL